MDGSVRYLWSAAAHLSNSSPALQFLKAHYAEKAIALAGGSSDFPEHFQSISSMCPNCSSFWSTGASDLNLRSSLKTRRCTRNFIRKHYRNKKSTKLNQLNAKLRRISRRLALLYFNSVQLTCNVCKGVTRIPFVRSLKKKGIADQEEPRNSSAKRFPNSPLANPPKKKKKKKDPFAGLNREVILAAQKRPQKLEESIQRPSIGKLASILKKKASISGSKLDSMLK